MVAHLEDFRLKEFPIDDQIGYRLAYKRIVKLFVLEGVVDQSILELLVMIRKKKSQSKLIFDDCFISFSNQNKDIGVCRATNVEELKKRIIDILTTPDVLHQLLPPVIVDNIVTEENIVDIIKTACQDEQKIDEDKIKEVRGIALAYNYNIPPFLLESGRKCALCVGFNGDSIIPVPDFVMHSVPRVTTFYPPNRLTVNKCEGYKIFENRDKTSHLCGPCSLYMKDNAHNWTDTDVQQSKHFPIYRMTSNQILGKVSSQGKEIQHSHRKIKTQDEIIKKLQNIIEDLKIQLELNIHGNQIEHEADDNTKEIISELFKSLEERVPGNSIDTILKQVLTEQTLVRACNLYLNIILL